MKRDSDKVGDVQRDCIVKFKELQVIFVEKGSRRQKWRNLKMVKDKDTKKR